jgi:hypothetical protein
LPENSEPTIVEKLLPEVLAGAGSDAGAGGGGLAFGLGGLTFGVDGMGLAAGFAVAAGFAIAAGFAVDAVVLRATLRLAEVFLPALRAAALTFRVADLRAPARFIAIFDFFAVARFRPPAFFFPPFAFLDFAALAIMSSAPCAIPCPDRRLDVRTKAAVPPTLRSPL